MGEVAFAGHFDDGIRGGRFYRRLRKSLTFRNTFGVNRPIRPVDVDLFVGIIKKSKEIAERLYPLEKFAVIFWDSANSENSDGIVGSLVDNDIKVHRITEILPNYKKSESSYVIPNDGHPNTVAHRLIAKFIADEVLVDGKPTLGNVTGRE